MLLLVLAMADTVSGAAQSGMNANPPAVSAPMAPATPEPVSPPATPATSSPAASTAPAAPPGANAGAPAASMPSSAAAPATADPGADPLAATGQTDLVAEPRDPWVKPNRAIFKFDLSLEHHLLAPAARGYVHVVPHVVRYHVTSALFNLGEPLTAVNDLLQLRGRSMSKAVFRFVINSTIGIAGLFDVAKSAGVPIHISDFGQTLGRYGLKPGNYVMLPLLGPSDVRDGFGRLVDTFIDPVEFLIGGITSPEGLSLFVLQGIDWRANADDTLKAVYSATDPYAFTRSAYTQFRASRVQEATGKQAALPDFAPAPGTP